MRITNREGYTYEPVPVVADQSHPPEQIARSKALFRATLELCNQLGPVGRVAQSVFAKYPTHAERARIAAAIVGVEPLELLTTNICYDLLLGASAMGCSTLALAGPSGPVLARNMDWFPPVQVAQASCLVNEEFGVNAGFLGMLGAVTGLSRRGFCLCLNAAFGGFDPSGYPVLLFLRHVLDTARDYGQAVEMVEREPLMSGGIITVVGSRNDERVVIERTTKDAVARRPIGSAPLVATNHFRKLSRPQECPRYEHLTAHAAGTPALEALTSRSVLQDITAQHVVMCPTAQTAEMYVPSHMLAVAAPPAVTPADLYRYFVS
ncbi:Acyl-coenzyme A:6-aminopenicillanic acid acyl-transferase [Gemmata obscuriglobus]|nr:C45 family peptidase [Gemmata obscuriglobus]QEG29955.1 Acyl-coenzyme A:6-aminopenicillanic acid acyl-transferase [Gemmata obscuriglobus]VTS09274.1 Peptidase C45 acyl-coenzyme A:6-aminopenicillanic acid acyl-transferase OS=Deinococcus maricopensis (strain DSM 21211 / LMG 22137 / NRRL B-23946 / LB-34) GN=Deima_2897 PE=4 SV=1: AAT [Gemmata obscuriglobus UQM 2246]